MASGRSNVMSRAWVRVLPRKHCGGNCCWQGVLLFDLVFILYRIRVCQPNESWGPNVLVAAEHVPVGSGSQALKEHQQIFDLLLAMLTSYVSVLWSHGNHTPLAV